MKYMQFKGLPLVRQGNTLYYGSMGDNEVVMLQTFGKNKIGDVEVATKVKLYRMLTDESVDVMKRITKTAEKPSLYEALDLAHDWLAR